MKFYYYLLLLVVFLVLVKCMTSPVAEDIPEGVTPRLSVFNISEFDINQLYIYSGEKGNYKDEENYVTTFFDDSLMNIDESIDFEENQFIGDYYITFIRIISSTSAKDVAVTTQSPLTIESGHYYLYILEDDFTYKVTEK